MQIITFGKAIDFIQDEDLEVPTRAPYAGCLSIELRGELLVCAMPQFIEIEEIVRPLCEPDVQFGWLETQHEEASDPLDFEPPLLAAGRFTTRGRPGTPPPLDWDY